MGDLIAAAALRAGGVPVKVTTLMLGATPKEGRFGIAVKPGSDRQRRSSSSRASRSAPRAAPSRSTCSTSSCSRQTWHPIRSRRKRSRRCRSASSCSWPGKLEAAMLPEPLPVARREAGCQGDRRRHRATSTCRRPCWSSTRSTSTSRRAPRRSRSCSACGTRRSRSSTRTRTRIARCSWSKARLPKPLEIDVPGQHLSDGAAAQTGAGRRRPRVDEGCRPAEQGRHVRRSDVEPASEVAPTNPRGPRGPCRN